MTNASNYQPASTFGQAITVHTFCLGPWTTNCYVLHAPLTAANPTSHRPCWIIDAGFDPGPMVDYIQRHNLTPAAVILTHAHLDHIAGLRRLRALWPDLPILIHEAERDFLTDPRLNLSAFFGHPVTAPPATDTLQDRQLLDIAGLKFQVRHTPGHSPGSIALYQPQENLVLVGDTLFAGAIGRFDFPTSDGPTLMRSIRSQLLTLPDNTHVLPGHGSDTTIGQERRFNPFLQEQLTLE